jgi:hypothetical protein
VTRRRNSCEHQPQAGSLQANTSGLRGKGLSVPGGACLVDYDEPSGPYERSFDRTSHLHPCLHCVHGKHDAMLGNAGQRPRHHIPAAREQCDSYSRAQRGQLYSAGRGVNPAYGLTHFENGSPLSSQLSISSSSAMPSWCQRRQHARSRRRGGPCSGSGGSYCIAFPRSASVTN